MESPFVVRPAVRADMPAVSVLAARLVRLHHSFDPARFLCLEPLEPGYQRWLTSELENPGAVIAVAEQGGTIIGYAYGRLEPRDWNNLLDACGALHDLYVDEGARRHGVAEALVRSVIARLEGLGAPRVVLHAASKNAGAQRLFERLGFRRTMVEMTREKVGG